MKQFITRLISISIIFALITVSILGFIYLISQLSLTLPPNKHILIIGDSQTETAIDDNIFSSSFNASQAGTAYIYSYSKLNKLLEKPRQIDTVLLSFSYRSLTKEIDDRWIFNSNKISIHSVILDKNEISFFMKNHKELFLTSILQLPKFKLTSIIKILFHRNKSFSNLEIGSYQRLVRDKLYEDLKRRNLSNSSTGEISTETEWSNNQLEYILKIVYLCKEKNVKLILISTPIYHAEKYGHLNELYSYYNTYLQGVLYADYSKYNLPDSCYGDIIHLNYKGAKIFSILLHNKFDSVSK